MLKIILKNQMLTIFSLLIVILVLLLSTEVYALVNGTNSNNSTTVINNDKYNSQQITTTVTTTTVEEQKVVAFTFDDGPGKYTLDLLNILDQYNANATFFEVGYNITKFQSTVLEVYQRGFEVGNHTLSHGYLTKLSSSDILNEVNGNNTRFFSITGANMNLVRPPYGAVNELVKSSVNHPIILWSVDSEDWKSRNTDAIVNEVLSNIQDGDIVLFHEIYSTTIDAIKQLLPILHDSNYKIVSVSELFSIKGVNLENGVVYRNAR